MFEIVANGTFFNESIYCKIVMRIPPSMLSETGSELKAKSQLGDAYEMYFSNMCSGSRGVPASHALFGCAHL